MTAAVCSQSFRAHAAATGPHCAEDNRHHLQHSSASWCPEPRSAGASCPLDSYQMYSLAGRAGIYLLQAQESRLGFVLSCTPEEDFIISDKSQSPRGFPVLLTYPWPLNEPAQQHTNS